MLPSARAGAAATRVLALLGSRAPICGPSHSCTLSWPSSSMPGAGVLPSSLLLSLLGAGGGKAPLTTAQLMVALVPEPSLTLRGQCEQMAAPGPCLRLQEELASSSGICKLCSTFFSSMILTATPASGQAWHNMTPIYCSGAQDSKGPWMAWGAAGRAAGLGPSPGL